jgi:hypothetical protein
VNREEWLQNAAAEMMPWLAEVEDVETVPVHVSIGWPSSGGLGVRSRTIGECWKRDRSEDGVNQIFVSPINGHKDTPEILGVLLHEMIHAVDDCESGHRKNFIRIARSVGFVSKWTSLNLGEELAARLEALADRLGSIPSAALSPSGVAAGEDEEKDKNRQLKVECAEGSGYKVRMTRKWIEDVGTPICPCHNEPMVEPTTETEES